MKCYGVGNKDINILPSQRGLILPGKSKPDDYTLQDEFNAVIQGMMSYYNFSDELMEELNVYS